MNAFQVRRVVVLATLVSQAHCQVKILGPETLVKEFTETHGIIYGTTATFGAPYYGERVLGQLIYGDTKGNNHCTKEDYDFSSRTEVRNGHKLVNVVLVRRGGCTFVTKVMAAQQKGAHAVVVVDKESSTLTPEQVQKIVMADDGSGHKVTIPSVLISSSEGQKLIDAVKREPVLVELAWDIPRGQVVVADFWMSSGSRESSEFLERFQDSAESLKYRLQFVPHFHIFSLPGGTGMNHLCASSIDSCDSCKPPPTKYCAPDPDGPGAITGGDVANEDLRRACIWNVTAKKKSETGAQYSQSFWDYVVRFFKYCPLKTQSKRFGYACSAEVMQALGIPVDQVQRCVSENFAEFLEQQLIEVAWSPQALRLNGWRYSGPLDPETVLKAVCSGYATPPGECSQMLNNRRGQSEWGFGFFTMLMITGAVVGVLAIAFAFYKRHVTMQMRKALREEVMLEVQTQMADYMPMEDKGDRGSSNRPALSF